MSKVNKTSSCWLWTGAINNSGYGGFWFKGKRRLAHRVSLYLFKQIENHHLLVCHSCDVRSCVNPDHLFAGSHSDNMQDCRDKGRLVVPRLSSNKTHCPHGHEYSAANTWINSKGWRFCRACNRIKATKRNHELRLKSNASAETKAI